MSPNITTDIDLQYHYRSYISLLNNGSFATLRATFLAPKIIHTDTELDPQGYCDLIYPHTTFKIDDLLLDVKKRKVAARLTITIGRNPASERKCRELVWYEFNEDWKICRAWSMVEEQKDGRWGPLVR